MREKRPIIIALAGLISSGKSTASTFLEDHFGFEVIRTRDVLSQYIIGQGQSVDDHSLQEYGNRIMDDGDGAKEFCRLIVQRIADGKSYVIDSIRPISHYRFIQEMCGDNFFLTYISSPTEERKKRYLSRSDGREATLQSFFARTNHPVESEVPSLIEFADAVCVNKDKFDFERQILSIAIPWMMVPSSAYFQEMIWSVEEFHRKHGYDVDTGNIGIMSLRIGLMIEELGEIHECISKGRGDIAEEHADLLYLLIGNCVTLGIDIEKAFFDKHQVNMQRKSKQVGTLNRVSDWNK